MEGKIANRASSHKRNCAAETARPAPLDRMPMYRIKRHREKVAGHKTITMSARYSHLSPAHKLSVVERIASASK